MIITPQRRQINRLSEQAKGLISFFTRSLSPAWTNSTISADGVSSSFNGSSDYIVLQNSKEISSWDRDKPLTIIARIKNRSALNCNIYGKQLNSGSYGGWGIGMSDSGYTGNFRNLFFMVGISGGAILTYWPHTFYNDGWFHTYAVTYPGTSNESGVIHYEDGNQVTSYLTGNILSSSVITTANEQVNGRGGANYLWAGDVNYIMVYNRVLNAKEISNIHYFPERIFIKPEHDNFCFQRFIQRRTLSQIGTRTASRQGY